MSEKNDFALVRKPTSAVEKAAPGTKRILSHMVADTFSLAKKAKTGAVTIADTQLENWFQTGQKYSSEKNWDEAAKWYRKAAERNYAPAQNMLGFCYDTGWGVPQDFFEAVKWYRAAAGQNYADAQYHLGGCYLNGDFLRGVPKDEVEAVEWFRKAAEQNHASAQSALGYRYYKGEGVVQDYVEAAKWYRKAAEQGKALAQDRLGNCYYNGEGVPQDYVEAAKWWRKAAEQNNPEAQYSLGCCYEQGQGVPQNIVEAYKFYKLAAQQRKIETLQMQQSRKAAENMLKQIVSQMTDVEIAEGERRYRQFAPSKLLKRIKNDSTPEPR
jgi:TPR repeat protein